MKYLLDTNVLLRLSDPASGQQQVAHQAVKALISRGESLCLVPQNLIEFWAVATRPVAHNGFGWPVDRTANEVRALLSQLPLLDDTADVFAHWLRLVQTHAVVGKKVHDARLVATARAHNVTHLLTFNGPDFARFTAEVTVVDPKTLSGDAHAR